MADKMTLFVTLSKEVPDRETGRVLFELIKTRLADQPDVKVRGHISNHFDYHQPEP